MDVHFLVDFLANSTLLYFFLELVSVQLKSDLSIPQNSSKFIALYLLLTVFKRALELLHNHLNLEILWSLIFVILLAIVVITYKYHSFRRKYIMANIFNRFSL
ncbi:sodium-dependent bicarbonate transport family permease [Aquimarina sp. 2201CG1-2-11]|uniref:sodium-dependent bicarbonate transport family permease n=1 Tax=Aquimarina discodermiae TaxID=3231043 RepID=UPI003463319D